ncbi:methyl-accepting chemotaxis protein [Alteromonas sp. BMJM2]|uniref:methyl-accepting chemotaxis protein n=1 Tax=Alteromonas sp. BMJM2 TaxID=2954241 RepID=UPI0022B49ADF|nr:methyl-accepting chemotaxis protein [Alteromonas sp. BMJM2]
MPFLRKLSILQLTLISAGSLCILLIYLAYKDINRSYSTSQSAEYDMRVITLIAAVERVAHHHAVERGLSAGFLGNPSEVSRKKVEAQRIKADEAITKLNEELQASWQANVKIKQIFSPMLAQLSQKAAIRGQVDDVNGQRAFAYYSALNAKALNVANSLIMLVHNVDSKMYLSQALLFAQLKEKMGQRRGKVNGAIASQSMTPSLASELKGYEREIEYISSKLLLSLQNDLRIPFKSIMESNQAQSLSLTTQKVITANSIDSTLPSNEEWFSLATAQILEVAALLSRSLEHVTGFADAQNVIASRSFYLTLAIIAFAIVFFVSIYRTLLSILGKQLTQLVTSLDNVARHGDLTVDLSMRTNNELGKISHSVNVTLMALRDLIRGLAPSIQTSKRLSGDLNASCDAMLSDAGNTQQLTANIASAIEEVSVTSRDIAQASLDTLEASKELELLANEALDVNDDVLSAMDKLNEDMNRVQANATAMEQQVTEIASILETINGLSDQTNLLALNAAIEAARAGDQGRGFAVVADEVRNLAQRSRSSSDKISSLLGNLQNASVVVVNDVSKNSELVLNSVKISQDGKAIAQKVKQASSNVEAMAHTMSAAAEQQSVTTNEVAKDVVYVEEAASQEVSIAKALAQLANDMNENNLSLQRAMSKFTVD